ncbi:MAG TPA: divergent polysaccharide deacetylase family protein [Xanthobacteraceae bacterium]|nr:divergent polysaccharide deacetylase family protein [Xanthobacteraceae bacterium]
MADDLSTPLGRHRTRKSSRLRALLPVGIAGLLGAWLAVFVVWAAVVNDPNGGEPMVVVSTGPRAGPAVKKPDANTDPKAEPKAEPKADNKADTKTDEKPTSPQQAAVEPPKAPPNGMQSVTIINGSSGDRQEVLVPANGEHGAVIDSKLLEKTRHGEVPRVSLDGARPLVAYARPVATTAANANMPRIAIVISGLGIGSKSTLDAISLPGPVTLAFAPYGSDLQRVAAHARAQGHELLLQLPMEPFDYPDNDPGPQTLLTSLAPEQNLDRVHWMMSRFQGYVGVANYMGSRFTASDAAFAPVLREVAQRGLMYLDDGTSPRSLAGQIAGANNLPFVKAGVVIDAVPTPNEIDRELAKLESLARDGGVAVGVATALPVSLAHIAKWAKSAESRGFLLVPISAAVAKPKQG